MLDPIDRKILALLQNNAGLSIAEIAQKVGLSQTPQVYSREVMRRMQLQAVERGWRPQSTMQLALLAGERVRAVRGEKTNVKITTPEDWAAGQHLEDLLR